jgi:hypothetical protein
MMLAADIRCRFTARALGGKCGRLLARSAHWPVGRPVHLRAALLIAWAILVAAAISGSGITDLR